VRVRSPFETWVHYAGAIILVCVLMYAWVRTQEYRRCCTDSCAEGPQLSTGVDTNFVWRR